MLKNPYGLNWNSAEGERSFASSFLLLGNFIMARQQSSCKAMFNF